MKYLPVRRLFGHKGAIYKIIDTKESHFYTCGGDGYVVRWDKNMGSDNGLLIAKTENPIYCAYLNELHNQLIVGCLNGDLISIDLKNNKVVHKLKAHSKSVFDIAAYRGILYSCGGDGQLNFYNENFKIDVKIVLSHQSLRCVTAISDELWIGSSDQFLYKIDLETKMILPKFLAHDSSIFALTNYNGILYSGGRDARIKIWETDNDVNIKTIDAHMATVNALMISNDLLFSASRDKTIRIWTLDGDIVQSLSPVAGGHINSVNTLTALKHTNHIASGSDDKSIIIWALE